MTTETAAAQTPAEKMAAACAALGLTMRAEFVPFSRSRNATPRAGQDKPWRSLNWRVTLERNGRPILTTDYAQGEGHAPAYKASSAIYARAHYKEKRAREMAIAHEIETGRRATWSFGELNKGVGKPIDPPPMAEVVWSLTNDANVLDYAGFEDWADNYGYSHDSRAAESSYRECLEIALKLRAAIGEAGLEALRTAGEDF